MVPSWLFIGVMFPSNGFLPSIHEDYEAYASPFQAMGQPLSYFQGSLHEKLQPQWVSFASVELLFSTCYWPEPEFPA